MWFFLYKKMQYYGIPRNFVCLLHGRFLLSRTPRLFVLNSCSFCIILNLLFVSWIVDCRDNSRWFLPLKYTKPWVDIAFYTTIINWLYNYGNIYRKTSLKICELCNIKFNIATLLAGLKLHIKFPVVICDKLLSLQKDII